MVLPLRLSSYSSSTRAGGTVCAKAGSASAKLISSQNELRIVAFDVDHAVAEGQLAVQEPAHGARIDHVLLPEHAGGESIRVVAGAHRHRRLHHDRAVVEV